MNSRPTRNAYVTAVLARRGEKMKKRHEGQRKSLKRFNSAKEIEGFEFGFRSG